MEFNIELKQHIAESFSKEYAYRVKIAADCGSEHMDIIEKCLAKYNFVSASAFKRQPIQENPVDSTEQKVPVSHQKYAHQTLF